MQMGYNWDTAGMQMGYKWDKWDTAGIQVGCRWDTAGGTFGTHMGTIWVIYPRGIPLGPH